MFNLGLLGNMAQMYAQFRQNPMNFLGRQYNIPQNIQSPQDIVQHLLNSGQVTQDQVNNAMRQAKSQPQFRQYFR